MKENHEIVKQNFTFSTIIGIDLAKQHCSLYIKRTDNSNNHVTTVPSCPSYHIWEYIDKLELNPKDTLIAFEACGQSNYFAQGFIKKGYIVKIINPNLVAAARGKSKKTDIKDAEYIASLAELNNIEQIHVRNFHSQFDASILSLEHELTKQNARLEQKLNAQSREFGFSSLKQLCAFLYQELKIKDYLIVKFAGKMKISKSLSNHINKEAVAASSFIKYISLSLSFLHSNEEEIKSLRKLKQEALQDYELSKNDNEKLEMQKKQEIFNILKEVPGVGDALAFSLTNKINNNIDRFEDEKKFMSYLGLTCRSYNTANSVKQRTTKGIGANIVKNNVYQAALSVYKQIIIKLKKSNDKRNVLSLIDPTTLDSWNGYRLNIKSCFKKSILNLSRQIISACFYQIKNKMA